MLKKLTGSNIVLASGVVILFAGLLSASLPFIAFGVGFCVSSYIVGGY